MILCEDMADSLSMNIPACCLAYHVACLFKYSDLFVSRS